MFNPTKIVPPNDYTFQSDLPIPGEPSVPESDRELLELTSEDGTKIFAVFVKGGNGPRGPAILYFHGNSDNIDHYFPRIEHFYNHGYSALIVDYRGYGRSEGIPTEEGLYMDARTALQALKERP